ncbi:MAG: STT3 domain-containing protein [Promethearchaeota archaeon]
MPRTGVKIKNFFRNLKDKARTSVTIKKQSPFLYLALLFIIITGVLIRMSPVFRGPAIIKAFDPWVQYDSTRELIQRGLKNYLSWHDNTMWYPQGKDRWYLRPGLVFTAAAAYYILNFLGIHVSIYMTCYYLPAFMGGLTILAMYFFGKEVLDKRAGLLAAFFLAFNPGHMQRTMVGFFDNETIGVFSSIMTLLFFIKAVKSGKPTHAVIAGLFLGYLTMSWGGLTFILLLIPLASVVLILAGKFTPRLLVAYSGTIGTGVLISTMSTNFLTYDVIKSDMDYAVPIIVLVFMVAYYFFDRQKESRPAFYEGVWRFVKWAIVPVIVVGAIILWKWPDILPFNLSNRMTAIIDPLIRDQDHVVASVGEHMPSPWSVFYFNTLIPLFLVPVGIFFCFRRLREDDIVLVLFVLTLYYFTGSMIRIVLLFAPAAAIVGAYGLAMVLKHFGQLMKKDKAIRSRRRKRQVKNMMGVQEGIIVFAIVGILLVVQVNHAQSVSISQMSWSELVAGGSFHDWEEALTWMKENLPGTAVVVSWWDYGYWMNVIGNVTTVNDNATFNGTRMGLTGMAFMQTDELESAKIFRMLGADYVLVYFGHLLNGLGGDEGKWPWMLRICNDHTAEYKTMGLETYNWKTRQGQDMVFDEAEYINSTSGKYEDKWFQSQLVRLMFAYEPTELSGATNNLQYFYARELNGDGQQKQARTDDNGKTWKSHIPPNGQYDFKVFKKEFFSTNNLVKIFKLDYTALDSSVKVRNQTLGTDGYGSAVVENTGSKEVEIKNVSVSYRDVASGVEYSFEESTGNISRAFEGGSGVLAPGDSKSIWYYVNTTLTLEEDNEASVGVTVEAPGLDQSKYQFQNSSDDFKVTAPLSSSIEIVRSLSSSLSYNDMQTLEYKLYVRNTGERVTKLSNVTINGYDFSFTPENDDYVLIPGASARLLTVSHTVAPTPFESQEVEVRTVDGASDRNTFFNNSQGYRLTVGDDVRQLLPEHQALELTSHAKDSVPVDLQSSVVYTNGTAIISVKNTGDEEFGIAQVYLKTSDEYEGHEVSFEMLSGDYFLDPGESGTIIADNTGLSFEPNAHVDVLVTGRGSNGKIAASDGGVITAIEPGPSISILPLNGADLHYKSYAIANETLSYMVKNTGNTQVTLDKFTVNGTTLVLDKSEGTFEYGPSTGVLGLQQVAVFTADITGKLKLNMSTQVTIGVNVTGTGNETTWDTEALLLSYFGVDQTIIKVDPVNATVGTNLLAFGIASLSEVETTIDAILINGTHIDEVRYLDLALFTYQGTSTAVDSWTFAAQEASAKFVQVDLSAAIGLTVVAADQYDVTIISKEGHQVTFSVTAA